jgi:hypothetical protein
MNSIPKLIVTMTTTPKRLPLIADVLTSILVQNIKPYQLIINIPHIFNRTGEKYPDPYLVFKNNKELLENTIVWNKECYDDGPITKLQGCLDLIDEKENVWIITIDDDVKYLQYTLELYLTCILRIRDKNAYGIAGFLWVNGNIVRHYQNAPVQIIEGYASCCYHRSFFPKKLWNSYLEKVLNNTSCKFSDDLIISNWLSLNNINRLNVTTPYTNQLLLWSSNGILDYGNESDALHKGGDLGLEYTNNLARYDDAKKHLKSINLLSRELY